MSADADAFMREFLAALRRGGPRAEPFTFSGTVSVSWDGMTCRIEGRPPATAGLTRVEIANSSSATVGVLMAGVAAPKTWTDALALLHSIDIGAPELQVPDWVIQIPGSLGAQAGQTASAIVTLPAAEVGVICGAGEWPKLDFFDAGAFPVGD